MKFTVVVPCYNEKQEDLEKTLAFMDSYFDYEPEYVIAENGSHLLNISESSRVSYYQSHAKGLGWALKEGLRHAQNRAVFFLPADLSYDLSFVPEALLHLGKYPLIIGSKAVKGSEVKRPLIRKAVSEVYNFALGLRFGDRWPLDITGVKAYDQKTVLPLTAGCDSNGLWFEVQLMQAVLKAGYRVKEIPVKVHDMRLAHFA